MDCTVHLDVRLFIQAKVTPRDRIQIKDILRMFSLAELVEMATLTQYEILDVTEEQ
jgi:hypothetical protein